MSEEDKVNEEFIEYWNDPGKKYKIMHLCDDVEKNYQENGFSKNQLFYHDCFGELSIHMKKSGELFLELWLIDTCYESVFCESKKDFYEALDKLLKICINFVKIRKMLDEE